MNDLDSSNFLAVGGILQTEPDQFIVILGSRQPVFNAIVSDPHQILVYSPQFWDFLQPHSKQVQGLFQIEKTIKVSRQQLLSFLEMNIIKETTALALLDTHQEDFEVQFEWSKKAFANNQLQKTVPATKFEYSAVDQFNFAFQLYLSLQKPRPGFIYGQWNETSGFMGLTPEFLAAWDGKKLSTMALAGTWSNDKKIADVAAVDLKTRQEHDLVIADIRERLGKTTVGETHILKLPTLSHLKTEIQKECLSLSDCIDSVIQLHPTAALGFYPRKPEMAKEFSQFSIQKERGFFGAPFGFFGNDFAHVIVAIRGLFWSHHRINIFVGCGVTAQSELSSEWQELETKKKAICEAFSLQIL